jgi:hypothetical protein
LVGWHFWNRVRAFGVPIDVADEDNDFNEPEPDLMVTTRPIREYNAIPSPSDLRLAVEISDSTVDFDLKVKGPLYARWNSRILGC